MTTVEELSRNARKKALKFVKSYSVAFISSLKTEKSFCNGIILWAL